MNVPKTLKTLKSAMVRILLGINVGQLIRVCNRFRPLIEAEMISLNKIDQLFINFYVF